MGEMKKEERGSWADPSALGLFGLAIVTLVACSQKLGITDGTAAVMGWAIFLGGCAQLIAGLIDLRKNNAFGGTAFIAYGLFWLAMAFGWATTNGMFGSYAAETFDPRQTGAAFVAYLILTAFMTIGALRTTKVLFFIFLAIDFLFVGSGSDAYARRDQRACYFAPQLLLRGRQYLEQPLRGAIPIARQPLLVEKILSISITLHKTYYQ